MEEKKIKFHDREYTLPILEKINLKEFDEKIKVINEYIYKLKDWVNSDDQKELDYQMFEYGQLRSDQHRILLRNDFKLTTFQDKLFSENRVHYTSDLTTRKAVNIATKDMISLLETQKECLEWIQENYWLFIRMADRIESRRIGQLADAKRNVL